MPSVSQKQHRFMEAVAHNPEFAAKVGVKQSVGKDFAKADDAAGITKKPGFRRIAQPPKPKVQRPKLMGESMGMNTRPTQ